MGAVQLLREVVAEAPNITKRQLKGE